MVQSQNFVKTITQKYGNSFSINCVPVHHMERIYKVDVNQIAVPYVKYHISSRNCPLINQRLIYKSANLFYAMEPFFNLKYLCTFFIIILFVMLYNKSYSTGRNFIKKLGNVQDLNLHR